MRHLLLVCAALLTSATGGVHAMEGAAPLTKDDAQFLEMVRRTMDRNLKRAHARNGDERYQPPRVTLDLARRNLVITNRFRQNPDADGRREIKQGMDDHQPSLCAALLPKDMQRTHIAIVMRNEMRSGSLIGQTKASPQTCR